ncbi:MAG: TraR/DksA C4-type zinc finger protein [Chloroflexota bacterium]
MGEQVKIGLDDKGIKQIKEMLIGERTYILERINALADREVADASNDKDSSALANSFIQRERQLVFKEQDEQKLEQIEGALQRLEEGRYGLCTRCGDMINVERLKVLPHAELCIHCQEEQDRKHF